MMNFTKLAIGAPLLLGSWLGAAADLAWIELAATNREPVSVAAPAVAAVAVKSVRGDEQTSAGVNITTFVPGTLCIIR